MDFGVVKVCFDYLAEGGREARSRSRRLPAAAAGHRAPGRLRGASRARTSGTIGLAVWVVDRSGPPPRPADPGTNRSTTPMNIAAFSWAGKPDSDSGLLEPI